MKKSCFLFCEDCKKEVLYTINERNHCPSCGREVILDKGVEELVVALNNLGLNTEKSCAGHDDGFDSGKWGHPWVIFHEEGDGNRLLIDLLVKRYNEESGNPPWVYRKRKINFGERYFLEPKNKSEADFKLQRECENLAEFVSRL